MFCWTCKHISPAGSVYCAHCLTPRSFNAIICGGGHRCQTGTRTCPTCSRNDFSQPSLGIPTWWIAKGIVIALLAHLWNVGTVHGGDLFPALWVGAGYAFGFATNSDTGALGRLVNHAISYGLLAWFFGFFLLVLPGQGGKVGQFLRALPLQLVQLAFRHLPRLAKSLFLAGLHFTGLVSRKSGTRAGKSAPKKDEGG